MSQVHPTTMATVLTATSATSRSLRNSVEANSLVQNHKKALQRRL